MASTPPREKDARTTQAVLLALLIAALAGTVVWSLSDRPAEPSEAADAGVRLGDGAIHYETSPLLAVHAPVMATCELAVASDRPEVDLVALTEPKRLAAMLGPRQCGAECNRVREIVLDAKAFEKRVMRTDDYILPPEDSWKDIAPSLSASDRTRLHAMAHLVVLKVRLPTERDAWTARTCFAVTAALVDTLGSYVYDETLRRIESAAAFVPHVIVDGVGVNPLRPEHFVVQSYRVADDTLRFVTLGLLRFGAFDFEVRDVPARRSVETSLLVARVAKRLVAGEKWPFTLPIERPHEGAAPVSFNFIEGIPREHDPESLGGRLIALEAGWEAAYEKLFGASDTVAADLNDPRLVAIARATRDNLPRLEAARVNGAQLMIKYRLGAGDAGEMEEMWMQVTQCMQNARKSWTCTGILRNTPATRDDVHMGDTVHAAQADVVDAILDLPDGGRMGGESEAVLRTAP